MQKIGSRTEISSSVKSWPNIHRRRGASTLFVVAAIAALAIAAGVFYKLAQVDERALAEAARPTSQEEVKAKRIELPPDQAEFRSRLAILTRGQGRDGRATIALAKPKGPRTHLEVKATDQALIGRELIRQALLIAARDELGLTTRDEVLDDNAPEAGIAEGIEVSSLFRHGGANRAFVRRFDKDGKVNNTILRQDLSQGSDKVKLLTAILPDVEALSRSEFPKLLKELGLQGEPNKIRADAPLPEGVEEGLTGLGFIENYSAIRDLHAAIRADGESPARLGALARGYAQLGVLTEFHWHPAHKAFKARALLYAQRLIARDPKSADGLRTRAFVRALIGLPQPALDDLAEATKLAEANKSATPLPAWQTVIELYAKSDLKELRSVDGPYARLAALLRLIAVEFPAGNSRILNAAKDTINSDPECYRAFDAISKDCGISILHYATVASPAYLSHTLPDKLKALKGLPQDINAPLDRLSKTIKTLRSRRAAPAQDGDGPAAEVVADQPNSIADEIAVVDALAVAGKADGDMGEPSWGVLAHLIRETRFVQVWRRLHFMATAWSVPVEDYWAAARPLVEHHRYRPYLEHYGQPGSAGRKALTELAQNVDVTELEHSETQMVRELENMAREKMFGIWSVLFSHDDDIVPDLSEQAWSNNGAHSLWMARAVLELSPRSAFAMSILVDRDWDKVKDKVDEWRKLTNDSPTLLAALAQQYTRLQRIDDARAVLQTYLKESPDLWAYETLASSYEAQGNLDAWRKTLKDYLDSSTEDRGLDRARVQIKLAQDLMLQRKWAEARPYADAAAETWAGWAMQAAARCAEELKDWEAAETWYQRLSERYPSTSWAEWFDFCKRTGHGDLDAAKKWTDAYLKANQHRSQSASLDTQGSHLLMSGEPRKALEKFDVSFQETKAPFAGVMLILVADQLGEIARRDRALDEVSKLNNNVAPKTIQICRLFRDELVGAEKKPLDLVEIDRILESIPTERRGMSDYLVGQYLFNRGRFDSARKYLTRCAESSSTPTVQKSICENLLKSKPPERKP